MTTQTETPTVDTVLARLECDLAALPGEDTFQRQLDANRTARAVLEAQLQTIRTTRVALANLAPRIAAETEWRDHLVDWRKTLCDELLALPLRIRDERTLGVQQNLKLSILKIDSDAEVAPWTLETLKLGQLMREAGYVEGPRIENQACGALPWYGSLPDVERRLQTLQQQRDAEQARLDESLLDDAERERRAAERRATFNATPQRKTRGDGSQFDRFPDGREVEVTS